jgi:choline dehydrogenase-like flavoprotein
MDGNNIGAAWIPSTLDGKNVTRSYGRTAHYNPVAHRQNLELLIKHYVSTVSIIDKIARGINIHSLSDNKTVLVRAKREVIIAAGAPHTPQVLQLSGIGPASLLNSLNIPVVEDLPGVGANFQDHAWAFVTANSELTAPLSCR